jgi:hypothetical protein
VRRKTLEKNGNFCFWVSSWYAVILSSILELFRCRRRGWLDEWSGLGRRCLDQGVVLLVWCEVQTCWRNGEAFHRLDSRRVRAIGRETRSQVNLAGSNPRRSTYSPAGLVEWAQAIVLAMRKMGIDCEMPNNRVSTRDYYL